MTWRTSYGRFTKPSERAECHCIMHTWLLVAKITGSPSACSRNAALRARISRVRSGCCRL